MKTRLSRAAARLSPLVLGCLLLAPVAAQAVEGVYTVEGIAFDGQPYTGEAQIVATTDVTCEVMWVVGNQESYGICMRMGDALAVAHEIEGEIGLGIYAIMPDGTLAGTWTLAGVEAVGKEVLTPR
jgi:hypothetical protein